MTAEGELEIQMPQLRNTAVKFVSRIIPDVGLAIRTRPLEVLVIGAYVRGLSDRDIESLSRRPGWASSHEPRPAGSARNSARAMSPSEPRAWTRSISWFSSWTRSTCRPDPAEPKKVCWWPGATPVLGNEFCSTFALVSESATRTGWRWAVA